MLTAVLGTALLLSACQPTPPPTSSIPITATAPRYVECGGYITVEGEVDHYKPPTPLVLQRTVNGKWQDWIWYETGDSDEVPHRIEAIVVSRTYSVTPRAPVTPGRTYSLRMRSPGGTAWSNTVWVTTTQASGGCPSSIN